MNSEEKIINGGLYNEQHNEIIFDSSKPPPFRIAEIRAAIPKDCWIRNPWRSLSYVLRDVVVVSALMAAAVFFNTCFFWPLYWVAQGTMFWAIFVIGHDWYVYIHIYFSVISTQKKKENLI